jgi:hypothetical protein
MHLNFLFKDVKRISLYTEKRHVPIKMMGEEGGEEEGVERQEGQDKFRNHCCRRCEHQHQHIITLSNNTSIFKECRNGKTAVTQGGGHSAHENSEIKSYTTGESV